MKNPLLKIALPVSAVIIAVLFLISPILSLVSPGQAPSVAIAQTQCTSFTDPGKIPAATLINIDDLPDATVIGDHYRPTFGVALVDMQQTQVKTYGGAPENAHSKPNVAINDPIAGGNNAGVPIVISFDEPKTDVGFYVGGNGGGEQITALMKAYDASGLMICEARQYPVPNAHTAFMGLNDPDGRIVTVSLDYGKTQIAESLDDL